MDETLKSTTDDVDAAFRTGEVFDASDTALLDYLRVLNTQAIPNDMVRHRATNRCITINAVVNLRLAKRIDRSNTILAFVVISIAAVDVTLTIIQILK